MAICTLHLYGKEKKDEIPKLFAEVPKLRQRIAGKSIPLEVSSSLCAAILTLTRLHVRNLSRGEPRSSRSKADA